LKIPFFFVEKKNIYKTTQKQRQTSSIKLLHPQPKTYIVPNVTK
jgi:hypothetical protein